MLHGLRLVQFNDGVYRVLDADGRHVGNLKRIGAIWKFKAIGYSATGQVIPGGGPLTHRHNEIFAVPDAPQLNARLLRPA